MHATGMMVLLLADTVLVLALLGAVWMAARRSERRASSRGLARSVISGLLLFVVVVIFVPDTVRATVGLVAGVNDPERFVVLVAGVCLGLVACAAAKVAITVGRSLQQRIGN